MDHCPKILIRFIQPENHRYSTCGDWLYDAESHTVEVRVSLMGDWRSELAVAIHEALEAVACVAADVSEVDVTVFDELFNRAEHNDNEEPGDDPKAPYHKQHVAATAVEKSVCQSLELYWDFHENMVFES